MTWIEKSKRKQGYWMKSDILKECGENPTGQDVLDYLIGDNEGHWSDYVVYKYNHSKRTIFQRVNSLWVIPVFIVAVFPFQWLLYGKTGFERTGKMGKILEWLVKFED